MIRPHQRLLICLTTALTVTLSLGQVLAQRPNNRRLAITRLDQVDDDFAYQGEYQGPISDADRVRRTVGLQVIALGDGEFAAVRYQGGLPGTGWDRRNKHPLEGRREGHELTLRGGESTAVVQRGSASIASSAGQILGQLKKVYRQSPTLGYCPPAHAHVLFDGTSTYHFKNGRINDEGLLEKGTELIPTFRDYTMHVEFRLPYMPYARGQGRSNSGVYLQSRYEVQVLDSFGLEGEANECGGLYRYQRPNVNMCLPPLSWQTYEITFRSPRFDTAGKKIQNARLTVHQNGVLVHNDFDVERKTGAGQQESPELLPIKFQDHGNPVHFRNIWLVDLERSNAVPGTCVFETPFASLAPRSHLRIGSRGHSKSVGLPR